MTEENHEDGAQTNPETTSSGSTTGELEIPMVVLDCFELSRYRRLRAVRLGLQDKTTVLVGANDSGKTSLLLAIQKFLAYATGHKNKGGGFSAYDLSADGWATLTKLSKSLEKEPAADIDSDDLQEERQKQLNRLLEVMPALDVWLDARDGAWHLVRDLIPTLEWEGGMVGIRLRLEPASTLEELDRLVEGYRNARSRIKPTQSDGEPGEAPRRTWPVDLLDFWKKVPSKLSRVVAYKLDPTRLKTPKPNGEAQPQALNNSASPLGEAPLRQLVRVDFVPAQRGLGGEEASAGGASGGQQLAGLLSAQLVGYARELLARDEASVEALESDRTSQVAVALEKAHALLDDAINSVMGDRVKEVRKLGYPGLGDVKDIVLRTEVHPAQALQHNTAVQYRSSAAATDAQHLPEHAIGLGYQNLLSLTFQLMRFRDDRLAVLKSEEAEKAVQTAPAIHLVMIEEPEAHLHVQVQRTFIRRAYERLLPNDRPELSTHLLVSTHSSHLAHAVDFDHLRYLRRMPRAVHEPLPTSVVVSLAGLFGTGDTADQETLRFVQRYLRVQHNDLLFADAVILVEGTAERVLVPAFIERDHNRLRSRYLSILDVGGSHAHRLRPLLDVLGIPILLLTDLDPVEAVKKTDKNGVERTTYQRRSTTAGAGLLSSNPSIKAFLEESSIDALLGMNNDAKLATMADGSQKDDHFRIAFQVPAKTDEPCASSLEDALVLENTGWFKNLPSDVDDSLGKVRQLTLDAVDQPSLATTLHAEIGKGDFGKGAFALDLFVRIDEVYEEAELACPRYIREGLIWLAEQLDYLDATLNGVQE